MLFELYPRNYNTKDGLVNGVDGIFKTYMASYKGDVTWMSSMTKVLNKSNRTNSNIYIPQVSLNNGYLFYE